MFGEEKKSLFLHVRRKPLNKNIPEQKSAGFRLLSLLNVFVKCELSGVEKHISLQSWFTQTWNTTISKVHKSCLEM